jgi:16S rRNA (guanine527-N7)-methyltransferase
VVTARAVAALPTLVELAAPLLSHGGRLIAFKGRLAQTEIGRGDTAAAKCGLRREGIRAFELTETGEARTLVTYRRVGDPSLALPRRVGMASKQPLA